MATFLLPQTDRITANSRKTVKNRVLEAQFGDGYLQRVDDGVNSIIETWEIQIAPLEGDNLTQIRSFIDTVGTTVPFEWTPLGETVAKNWRIDPNSLQIQMINTSKFIYSFTMTRIFLPPAEFTTEFTSEFW